MSADGDAWFLLNASPEVRAQIEGFPALHPRAQRHSPIAGDRAHERRPRSLPRPALAARIAPARALRDRRRPARASPSGNVLYRTLQRFPGQVTWRALELGREAELVGGTDGRAASSLSRGTGAGQAAGPPRGHRARRRPEDNVGLRIRDARPAARLASVRRCDRRPPSDRARSTDADCVFFDGTFWSQRRAHRRRPRHAARRGHGALADRRRRRAASRGSRHCARAAHLHPRQQHNPILREDSPERRAVARRGLARSRTTAWSSSCERGRLLVADELHRPAPRARASAATTIEHPFHRRMHAGKLDPRRAPGVGAEPLLLPDAHPDQGRDHPLEVRGPRVPARVDPPHPRSRRRARPARAGSRCGSRLAEAVGLDREEVRELPARAAGRALRLRRLRRRWCASARSSRRWRRR